MTDGQVSFDPPMCFLSEISHNVNCKLVVWNVNGFTVFTSNNCWWPPANMLQIEKKTSKPREVSKGPESTSFTFFFIPLSTGSRSPQFLTLSISFNFGEIKTQSLILRPTFFFLMRPPFQYKNDFCIYPSPKFTPPKETKGTHILIYYMKFIWHICSM